MKAHKALRSVPEEPPGVVDQNDIVLAQTYVRDIFISRTQHQMLHWIEGKPDLLGVAAELVGLSEEAQRAHRSYRGLRTDEERRHVRNFLCFLKWTQLHIEKLKGPNGERHRHDYQSSLRRLSAG